MCSQEVFGKDKCSCVLRKSARRMETKRSITHNHHRPKVVLRKCLNLLGNCQGREPSFPITPFGSQGGNSCKRGWVHRILIGSYQMQGSSGSWSPKAFLASCIMKKTETSTSRLGLKAWGHFALLGRWFVDIGIRTCEFSWISAGLCKGGDEVHWPNESHELALNQTGAFRKWLSALREPTTKR